MHFKIVGLVLAVWLAAMAEIQAQQPLRVLFVGGDWKAQLPNYQGQRGRCAATTCGTGGQQGGAGPASISRSGPATNCCSTANRPRWGKFRRDRGRRCDGAERACRG